MELNTAENDPEYTSYTIESGTQVDILDDNPPKNYTRNGLDSVEVKEVDLPTQPTSEMYNADKDPDNNHMPNTVPIEEVP